jgi:hypothetical protein
MLISESTSLADYANASVRGQTVGPTGGGHRRAAASQPTFTVADDSNENTYRGLKRLRSFLPRAQRLPTHKMLAIGELLPHRWQPRQAVVIA